MFSLWSKLGSASSTIFLILTQVVPLIAELKNQAGQAITDAEKSAITNLAIAALSTIEGIAGGSLATDPDVQKLIADAVEIFAVLHDKLRHAAPAPAKAA